MSYEHEKPLAPLTTFKIGGPAQYYADAATPAALREAVTWANENAMPWCVIGGGSNVLVSDEGVAGLVIRNAIRGVCVERDGEIVTVTVAAGEPWDELVADAVENGWWGIENLSAIPGTVGAAPVQNIGAYGTELADVFHSLEALDTRTGEIVTLQHSDCRFGYRDSIFKHDDGRHYIITHVTITLQTTPRPHIAYRDLAEYFADRSGQPSLSAIREAVCRIRAGKFPDLRAYGTAGSFFKNPIVSRECYESLRNTYPDLPFYALDSGWVKIPAAWLLDRVCSLRGYNEGAARFYDNQPLVIVNDGGATAADITALAGKASECVRAKTGIELGWEVTPLGGPTAT